MSQEDKISVPEPSNEGYDQVLDVLMHLFRHVWRIHGGGFGSCDSGSGNL